jgi:hypothetical protein
MRLGNPQIAPRVFDDGHHCKHSATASSGCCQWRHWEWQKHPSPTLSSVECLETKSSIQPGNCLHSGFLVCIVVCHFLGCLQNFIQPRRISATSLASRVSKELGDPCPPGGNGSMVGYQVRMESKMCDTTRLIYCTTVWHLKKLCKHSY